jgi:uncharacterized protein YndB with AHSA1/START domain
MAAIVKSIEISRSPEDVFSYVTDPSRLPEWQESVVSVRREDDAPITVGTRAVVTRRVGRREQAMTAELAELNPPRSWAVRGIDGPVRGMSRARSRGTAGGFSPRPRPERSLEVPAEVDLLSADLVAVEREDLGVAKPAPVGLRAFVGHDDLVSGLDEPLKLERLDQLSVRPAALEVPRAVDPDVGRTVEREILGQELLDDAPIAGHVCAVYIACEL